MAKTKAKQKKGKAKQAQRKATKPSAVPDKPARAAITKEEKLNPHSPRKVAKLKAAGATSVETVVDSATLARGIDTLARAAEDQRMQEEKAVRKAELKRLDALGLKEYAVPGTSLTLIGMKVPGKAPENLEQRVEMAKRLNEVGPRLPHYIKLVNYDTPAQSVAKILDTTPPMEVNTDKRKVKRPGKVEIVDVPKELPAAPARKGKKGKAEPSTPETDKHGNPKAAIPCPVHSSCACTPAQRIKHGEALARKAERTRAEKEERIAAAKAAAKKRPAAKPSKAAPKRDADPGAKVAGVSAAPKSGGGIGGIVCKALIAGKDDDAILALVKKDYPHAKTSPSSIAWYRSKLRGEGKLAKA